MLLLSLFLLFSLLPPSPTPFICKQGPRACSVPNSAQDAKAMTRTSRRDKDPASQNPGLLRKDNKRAFAVPGGRKVGENPGWTPRLARSGGRDPPPSPPTPTPARLHLQRQAPPARLHPPRPGSTPLSGRPHVPLGDGVLNSQQALDWVDVLVHSELLGSDNRLPPMYRSLH